MLTVDQALQFLRDHQPMPPDGDGPDELFARYSEVRVFFRDNPDARCLPLFLTSFGEGNGRGNYQLVEDVFRQFPDEQVLPCLSRALATGNSASRYWVAQIASIFPSDDLVDSLVECLRDEDAAVRHMAVVCLEQINSSRSQDALQKHRDVESEQDILLLLDEVLSRTSG
jgi:hypothetical protein